MVIAGSPAAITQDGWENMALTLSPAPPPLSSAPAGTYIHAAPCTLSLIHSCLPECPPHRLHPRLGPSGPPLPLLA
eukprot:12897096-Prorocentrum_lima.AAC.1